MSPPPGAIPAAASVSEEQLREWIDELAHLLPSQRPLEAFVHHNTLHSFEHLPFHVGVEEAAALFGAEPYMAEEAFRSAWSAGRVLESDLRAVLAAEVPDEAVSLPGQTWSLRELVRAWMLELPTGDASATLRWRLEETDELGAWPRGLPRSSFERLAAAGSAPQVQAALWRATSTLVRASEREVLLARPRDAVLLERGVDCDDYVNPVLIRWCGAFLDPGHSYWPMSEREQGFYATTLAHLSQGGPSLRGWARSARRQARGLREQGTPPLRAIAESLARLGLAEEAAQRFLRASLLSLPGWPGMFVQLAARPDLAPAPPPPTDLEDFLAIRLLLDEAAARAFGQRPEGPFPRSSVREELDPERAWTLFNAARLLGVLPGELERARPTLEELLQRYGSVRRRWLWQLAYERRYRHQILDGVLNHWERVRDDEAPAPEVQVVTCIDDREESLRRHLEELGPRYQTFGAAGFYGVAAYFRPLGEPHQRPLCPANVVPTHLLQELSAEGGSGQGAPRTRGWGGRLSEALRVGSDTLFRGGLISLWGWSSLLPFVGRVLAPRLYGRLSARPSTPSRLRLEAEEPPTHDHGLQVGFTPAEMAQIVQRILEDMGLTRDFAPLVVVLGHGSRSLNNPHEAAHDCGACGGGRGGPNARAFAEMANRPDVRLALCEAGIDLPQETWFVGGYHNTCDDALELYDLDRVPSRLQPALARARQDLDLACALDAHERVRRFDSAPLTLTPAQALAHVEARAEDLAQPRPEYGHCTNALCLVGRRAWSRGLFLDRRVFLTSYDPAVDTPERSILERLLASVGPVGAGINLEYYFSFVDPNRYGCNTKLPHNITALLGVMDGHSSDLRTGLPWQMVEIHEPVRLLNVIEARPEELEGILARQPGLRGLIEKRWILVAAFDPQEGAVWFLEPDGFRRHEPEGRDLPRAESSPDYYGGRREHLVPATIERGRAARGGAA